MGSLGVGMLILEGLVGNQVVVCSNTHDLYTIFLHIFCFELFILRNFFPVILTDLHTTSTIKEVQNIMMLLEVCQSVKMTEKNFLDMNNSKQKICKNMVYKSWVFEQTSRNGSPPPKSVWFRWGENHRGADRNLTCY